jgi:hypothetical protein
MAETTSSEPFGEVTSMDPAKYFSTYSIKVLTEMIRIFGINVLGPLRVNLTNVLGHVIRALFEKSKGKSLNEGVESMNISIEGDDYRKCPPHPPCPSHCPCMEQEYVLSEGHKVTIEKGKEVKHDFILDPSPFRDCGTLSGRVKDKHGHPIPNALVKVFDLNHDPIAHVFTNKDGEFLICLPAGHYLVKAVR